MRTILHVDMDAFYASIEERDNPALRGKPVIVGGDPSSRGVVSAANYVARRYGVHSAMPSSQAKRLCPDGIFLPVRMGHYAAVSREIQAIFMHYTPLVEPLSLDEAFLDVTESRTLFGNGEAIGRAIKREIADKLGLTASVGIAPNKFLAKIASDLDKPDGFVMVDPERVENFLEPLPVERLWGVGKAAAGVMRQLRIKTIGDLRRLPVETLEELFGKWGRRLWELARGLDDRPVVPDHQAKSLSHETTFEEDIGDPEVLRSWLLDLTEQVARRLRRHELKGRTVTVKVRFNDFRTITRSHTLPAPTDVTQQLWDITVQLLNAALRATTRPVRLIGMGVSGLETAEPVQASLFDAAGDDKQRQVDALADAIKDRFGNTALHRASGLKRTR